MCFLNLVIPTHNRPDCIERIAVELNEIDPKEGVSVVVVDDASRENYKEKLRLLEKKCSNIRFEFLEKNAGAPAARNYGWKKIESEWVWFFDDDDYVRKDEVIKVVRILKYNDVKEMVFLSCRVNAQGGTYMEKMEGEGLNNRLSRYGQNVNTSCAIFRSNLIDRIEGWDAKLVAGQDTDLFLRASEYTDATIIDAAVDVFHDGQDRITKNPRKQMKGKFQFLMKNWKRLHWLRRVRYMASIISFWPYVRRLFS